MTVYMTEGSTGTYEVSRILLGIFTTRELAETAVQEHLTKSREFKQRYSQEDRQLVEQAISITMNREIEDGVHDWPEEQRAYWNWKYDDDRQEMSDWTAITEVELDKQLYW